MRGDTDRLLVINSAYRSNLADGLGQFSVHFAGAVHMQNITNVRVKSVTLPNMFPNIYGAGANLYIRFGGAVNLVTLTTGIYETASELIAAVCAGVGATTSGVCTGTINADGYITLTNTVAFTIMSIQSVTAYTGVNISLNSQIGAPLLSDTIDQTVHVMPAPVSLNGVRKVIINSEKLSFAKSMSANSRNSIGSQLCAVPLTSVSYGFVAYWEPTHSHTHWFGDSIDCNSVDISLTDEYNQQLSLPHNQHIEIELVLGSYLD